MMLKSFSDKPPIGTLFGSQFRFSGYHLAIAGLAPGVYDFTVKARSTVTGLFNVKIVRMTVSP